MKQKAAKKGATSPKNRANSAKTERNSPQSPSAAGKPKTESQLARDKVTSRARYDKMSPAEKAERRWRSMARPPQHIPGSKRHGSTRYTALSRAWREWSDPEEVVRIYRVCAVLNELGIGHFVVDHIVPIQSRLVCGLHTHDNLRIISRCENLVKSNWFWPDMWPMDWTTLDLLLARP